MIVTVEELKRLEDTDIYHMDGCVKRIEDFYLEEVILFQIQQHIMELGESDKLLQTEKEGAAAESESLRKKCRDVERAIDKAKAQRMAEFEAYALGQKKSYDASIDEVEVLRKKHDELIIEIRKDASLAAICEQMGRTPPWVEGLMLVANGYETAFYMKK